jgi:hypothetical protein
MAKFIFSSKPPKESPSKDRQEDRQALIAARKVRMRAIETNFNLVIHELGVHDIVEIEHVLPVLNAMIVNIHGRSPERVAHQIVQKTGMAVTADESATFSR